MAAAIPWSKVKAEWLKGGITQAELAKKYHCSVKTIQNRAYKEGWKNEKGKIREKVEEKTRERIVRARENHLEKLIAANEMLLDGLMKLAEEISSEPVKMLTDKTGSIKSAESFAKAIQTAALTQRDLYGMKNIDQKFAQKKWAAEQKEKKAAAGEAKGTVWQVRTEDGEPLDE